MKFGNFLGRFRQEAPRQKTVDTFERTPKDPLWDASNQLRILEINFKGQYNKDPGELQIVLASYSTSQLQEMYQVIEYIMTGFESISPEEVKPGAQEEVNAVHREKAQFFDLVEKLIVEIIKARKQKG